MPKQVLVEFKDIVAISPMATFTPESNELAITLLLRKDTEFSPEILKLSNGVESFVYPLEINEAPQAPVASVATPVVPENDVAQLDAERLQALDERDQAVQENEKLAQENDKLKAELEAIKATLLKDAEAPAVPAPVSDTGTQFVKLQEVKSILDSTQETTPLL